MATKLLLPTSKHLPFLLLQFTYEGLPYLSKAEEEVVERHVKEDTLFLNLSQALEIAEEKELQLYCSEVAK